MNQLGEFTIEGVLGEGGSAVVHAARGPDGEAIALKVARAGAIATDRDRRRFLEEATRLGLVEHPAVVRVLSSGLLPDGRPFVAMPLLEGETLARRLDRGRLSVEEALAVFEVLAAGVSALHEAGLVHRDLKPENVFLAGSPPAPVLLDLGIAREVDAPDSTTTVDGLVRGTRATMAPERLFGRPASVASDVYELALVLYAMLVGALPWDDTADVDARLSAASPSATVVEVPQALSDVILRALSTRTEKRPVSARALARLVREAASAEAPVTTNTSPPPRRTAAFAPEAPRAQPRVSPSAALAPQPPAGSVARARLVGAGTGLVVALVVLFASRMRLVAPAPSARPEIASAPEAPPTASSIPLEAPPTASSIPLEAPWPVVSVIAPSGAASVARGLASPSLPIPPIGSATPSVAASARAVVAGAPGACDRLVAFACATPRDPDCGMVKMDRASWQKSVPAKAEANCRILLDRLSAERAQAQIDADNLAKSPACTRYLGAACAPHVLALPDGSRVCSGVKRFARARAAEGAAGEAACGAAEVGLPAVLQGLAQKVEERRPLLPPTGHSHFGLGQM